ncbi:MAG: glycosyltransferase family 2 protein [Xenococcaceae cyanobacterium MO_188.B29]|nr:glycosyltransferase family 2 protein [Xenococcaceae cyanobacterium MO_188.B29]
MKFTIIITTYNRLSLLKRAVESALNQTIACEVVVADDGSNDGTEEYIESLGDRVVYHRNSVNIGHSATVNAGINAAQGDWIKLLDDDDYLAPNCIEKLTAAIQACPQAAICSCQAIQVDMNGSEVSRTDRVGSGKACYISQEDIHYGMLLEVVPFGTPVQVSFKKEAFIKSGGWNSDFDGNCDDIYSWIQIAKYGDAVFVNEYLGYRTIWSGSCHKQLTLQQRLETNFILKQEIYTLISEKYRSSLPELELIQNYLKLHWFLVGLKHKQPLDALKVAGTTILSYQGWAFILKIKLSKVITQKFLLTLQQNLPQLWLTMNQKQLLITDY